jgi:hypothetical protein
LHACCVFSAGAGPEFLITDDGTPGQITADIIEYMEKERIIIGKGDVLITKGNL